MRVSDQSSFIRSIRVRYLSGLLIFALSPAAPSFRDEPRQRVPPRRRRLASDFVRARPRPAQRRRLRRDRRRATGAPIRATSWRARLSAMPSGSTRRSGILDGRVTSLRPQLVEATARETAVGLGQRRPVLVGPRHRPQSRHVRRRGGGRGVRPIARSATRTTSSRSRC